MITTFISVLGGFCFLMCAFYLVKDREKADAYTRTHDDDSSLLGSVGGEHYPPTVGENQALENDDDYSDDDKLLGTDSVNSTPSERKSLVVPVDVHGSPPVQGEHSNHVV